MFLTGYLLDCFLAGCGDQQVTFKQMYILLDHDCDVSRAHLVTIFSNPISISNPITCEDYDSCFYLS